MTIRKTYKNSTAEIACIALHAILFIFSMTSSAAYAFGDGVADISTGGGPQTVSQFNTANPEFINWLSKPQEVSLIFNIGQDIDLKKDDLRKAVSAAEACWNKALVTAGASALKLSLSLSQVTPIQNEVDMKGDYRQPGLQDNGKPLDNNILGAKTSTYNIFLSRHVSRSHVKPVWAESIDMQTRLLAIQASKYSLECDQIFYEELDPIQSKDQTTMSSDEKDKLNRLREKYHSVCQKAADIEDNMPDMDLPMGSQIYISPKGSFDDLVSTLAHELGHAWGGLDDRYKGNPASRARNANNLMGINTPCILEMPQIESIFNFRKSGKQEDFSSAD